jgi:DNA-binding NarL/FixJ family response regulator
MKWMGAAIRDEHGRRADLWDRQAGRVVIKLRGANDLIHPKTANEPGSEEVFDRRRPEIAGADTRRVGSGRPWIATELVTVVVGRFDEIIGEGLVRHLATDSAVEILASGVNGGALQNAVACWLPRVVVVAEAAVCSVLASERSAWPETGVLVVAHDPSRAFGRLLLSEGVACVADNITARDLLAAVHLVAAGGHLFASRDGQRVEPGHPDDFPALTVREMEVLGGLSEGRRPGQIALALGISIRTVQAYVIAIRRKLAVKSARDLIGLPVVSGDTPTWDSCIPSGRTYTSPPSGGSPHAVSVF